MSPSDLGVFVFSTRGAAADEAGGSSAVRGNTMAAIEQAVCTGVRKLRVTNLNLKRALQGLMTNLHLDDLIVFPFPLVN